MPRFVAYIVRTLAVVAVVALGLAGGVALWLRSSLPEYEGTAEIAGMTAPAEVLRDAEGLVTIRATDLLDAYRALGFVHAQDRLWQMDLIRRSGAGRVSEIVGKAALPTDRIMRTLGFSQVAEANYRNLDAEVQDSLKAYSEGVNAFIRTPGGALPLEFQLLFYDPEPWTPVDSIIWGRLMALQLSGNWRSELLRARLAERLSPEQLAQLWPPYPADAPITVSEKNGQAAAASSLPTGLDLADLLRHLPWTLAPKSASNAWVVSGKLTTSGRPILANDPHLSLDSPGFWYLVRIETPELTLAGATSPGVPFHLFGHNGRIAWGLTTTHSDTQDLFIEKLSPEDSSLYKTPDGWRALDTRSETIQVRWNEPETLTVRRTRNGPVLSELPKSFPADPEAGHILALAWPALRDDDRTAHALYALNRARDWSEFKTALRDFDSPQQNVFYADTDGNIGFLAPGRVPIRKAGDGRQPVPGWNGKYDWTGFIPFEDLPMMLNPKSGRIYNANNRIVPEDYGHLLAADWPDAYRAERLKEVLTAQPPIDVAKTRQLQQDIVSTGLQAVLPRLLSAPPLSSRGKTAVARLAAWNFRMAREAAEPLIAYSWIYALNKRLLADELGSEFPFFQGPPARRLTMLLDRHPGWCDDISTLEIETCDAQIALALEEALDFLAETYGNNMKDWRWGEAHWAPFPHQLLSRIPLGGALFGFGLQTDGDDTTINRGGTPFAADAESRFVNRHGAGYRAIYDLNDLDNSRFMIATGQSGNPLSPLYGNLAERWRDGEDLMLDGSDQRQVRRLLLEPATEQVSAGN